MEEEGVDVAPGASRLMDLRHMAAKLRIIESQARCIRQNVEEELRRVAAEKILHETEGAGEEPTG